MTYLPLQRLPVGLELDAPPGNDRALLGLGIAVQEVIGLIPPPFLSSWVGWQLQRSY